MGFLRDNHGVSTPTLRPLLRKQDCQPNQPNLYRENYFLVAGSVIPWFNPVPLQKFLGRQSRAPALNTATTKCTWEDGVPVLFA